MGRFTTNLQLFSTTLGDTTITLKVKDHLIATLFLFEGIWKDHSIHFL